jgi:hypothetical protein
MCSLCSQLLNAPLPICDWLYNIRCARLFRSPLGKGAGENALHPFGSLFFVSMYNSPFVQLDGYALKKCAALKHFFPSFRIRQVDTA